MNTYDVIVIGGGPAGLAAALEAKNNGVSVAIIEREDKLGGILKQCIHDGFGLTRFKEQLSGPEYAHRYIQLVQQAGVEVFTLTFVSKVEKKKNGFVLTIVNDKGVDYLKTKVLVLATGCRERTPRQVNIHGDRLAGIFTAGNSQNYINLLGQNVGKKCVILGSGDIGLIMARRLTLEGSEVVGVYEIMNHPAGLPRNIQQCLNDYNIPLHLSTTVTKVFGERRVEKVEIAKVDEQMKVIEGTQQLIDCDCLIVSVGLIPENELASEIGIEIDPKTKGPLCDTNYQTSVNGIFSCGNSLHVFDLVDYVSLSGVKAGKAASDYVKGELAKAQPFTYVAPKRTYGEKDKLNCIICPNSCVLNVHKENGEIVVEGNKCERGRNFAIKELTRPVRSISSTVKTTFADCPVLPVRTNGAFAKELIFDVMKEIKNVNLDYHVHVGDVIIKNVCDSGVDVIACAQI